MVRELHRAPDGAASLGNSPPRGRGSESSGEPVPHVDQQQRIPLPAMTRPAPGQPWTPALSRREMLRLSGLGLGALALEFLVATERAASAIGAAAGTSAVRLPHVVPRARAVILLMQNGGPSQMDLFDPKPDLKKFDGAVHSEKVEVFQKGSEANKLLGSPFVFQARGGCGMKMSEVIPCLGSVADDLCMVRSMHTEHNNHTEALVMFNTGKIFPGRPALGSWIS